MNECKNGIPLVMAGKIMNGLLNYRPAFPANTT
jgi:hypothetical protein